MKAKLSGLMAAILAAIMVLEWTRPAPACGPFFYPPVFTEMSHPDFPVWPYTGGKLGVLQPKYFRIYLYVAYRNLVGPGFTADEARRLWDRRGDLTGEPEAAPPTAWQAGGEWIEKWKSARSRVPNVGTPSPLPSWELSNTVYRSGFEPGGTYLSYPNCLPAAFQTAVATLSDRTLRWGATSPELAAWVKAQDQVFSNCAGREKNIPAPLSAAAPALAREDREYQTAAAYFYASDFIKAESEFRAISSDHDSPWSKLASYLIARVYVREATLGHDDSAADSAAFRRAESYLQTILADPKLAEIHLPASRLLDLVEVRLHPEEQARKLSQSLLQEPAPADLAHQIQDYTYLLDKHAIPHAQDDLTDWILTFQDRNSSALDHAYEKWHATKSPAWLVAAITKVSSSDPRAAELGEAARAVLPSSPAYDSVTFHRLRLMILSGEKSKARRELDRLLAEESGHMPRSALNLFLAERMSLAQDLNEFLRYSPRVPAELTYPRPKDAAVGQPWFDLDALMVLNNLMPLDTLTEVAESKLLPEHLRRQVALGAWTRAFLLADDQAAVKLAPVLGRLVPEMHPDLTVFANASTLEERRFAGTLLILRFPGLRPYITSPERATPVNRIDNLRENWWGHGHPCGGPWGNDWWSVNPTPGVPVTMPEWPELEGPLTDIYPSGKFRAPAFLDANELQEGRRVLQLTRALPVATIALGRQVLDWVGKHPDDPRAAEALALVVRAGHLGCPDKDSWKFSKQAFDMLHQHYPASSWAKQTKYWYR